MFFFFLKSKNKKKTKKLYKKKKNIERSKKQVGNTPKELVKIELVGTEQTDDGKVKIGDYVRGDEITSKPTEKPENCCTAWELYRDFGIQKQKTSRYIRAGKLNAFMIGTERTVNLKWSWKST
jgi:hypothetical protein